MLKRFFAPPHFESDEQNLKAGFLNNTSWLAIALLLITIPILLITGYQGIAIYSLLGIVGTFALSLFFVRKGNIRISGILVAILTWGILTYQAYTQNGARDVVIGGYFVVVLLSSIIFSIEASILVTVLCVGAIWGLALLENSGKLAFIPDQPLIYARDLSLVFVVVVSLIYFITISLKNSLRRSQSTAAELKKSNQEFQALQSNLEKRIEERTSELMLSNQRSGHHAKQYEAIAQVARATTSIQNPEILLQNITKLISEQFGFYHVGVFLMDDNREFAVLMAANSKGGKNMLAHKHKLKVGQVGIVGYVTGSGNPRIALDVGADAIHFDNPDLPDTRSELALPLHIGEQIIGALDVQSLEPNAFSQDDVQILSTLADQIAIAIQNARSFEESRKLLQEARSTYSSYMTESWQALRPIQKGLGYQFSENAIKVLERPIEGTYIKDALKKGMAIISGENSNKLAIPIRLRGQVVGVMNLQTPAGQAWDQDQIDIATATAERLSLAIENATLLQATQRRADIERITSNISARISSSTRYEMILQTTAEELSRALGGSDILVQIEPSAMKMNTFD